MDFYTSELSAVNAMLATIGEAPVNTIEDSGLVDVTIAKQALDEVTRAVLVEGWRFNTDTDYPLAPEGFAPFAINLPSNAMSVLPNKEYAYLTPRGNRLYDTRTFSFNFQGHPPVPCQVIWALTFNELPEVTRQFVAVAAARLFQNRTTASEFGAVFTAEDERRAKWTHTRNNVRVNRKNFLFDSASVRNIHLNR